MAGLSAPDRDRRIVDVAVDRAARVVAVCSVVLLPVFAFLDSLEVASDGAGLLVRLAVFGAAALLQVTAYTAVGRRFARLLLLAVPAAIVADTAMMFQAGRAGALEIGVRTAIVAASMLLVASVRAGATASAVVASMYVAALAVVGPMAVAPMPVGELVRATAESVARAGLPIFVFAAAGLAALLARQERRARMALVAHARRQETLATIGELALGGTDGDAFRGRAVALAREVLGADTTALFQLATDGKTLDIHAADGWTNDRPGQLDVARRTFARCVLDAGAPVVFDDVAADKRFAAPTLLRDDALVSGVAALVVNGGKPSGILAAFSKRRAAFTTEDGAFLDVLARMLAAATSRLADTRTLADEAQVATALARVGSELISSVDTPIVLDRVCQLATEVLQADHSQSWLADGEDAFVPIAGHGFAPETWGGIAALRIRTSSMASMMKRLERDDVIEVNPAANEHPFLEALLRQFGIGRALVVTLHRGAEVIGVQVTGRAAPDPFAPEQAKLAIGIARLASLALANAHLVEEAEHASQLKSEFLSTMSHELRTPLNVIIGYLDMLAEEPSSPEHADILGRVRGSSLELLDMIEGTLNLNRIEAGQDIPQLGEVSVDELWDELRAEFAVHPRKTDAVVRWEPVHAAALYTDRRRLKAILKNLVGNAVKFTPAGEVVVRCEPRDRAYVFSVRDTGVGIPASHLPIVFDMFRQVDSSESRSYAGAGLGLYIVKRLLDQLGGTVEVESEVGIGSTFRVTLPNESMPSQSELPARAAAAPSAVPPGDTTGRYITATEGNLVQASNIGHAAATEVPRRKQRILYADDLELNRQLLRRLVARHMPDVEFYEACDGKHALAVFEAQQPDLVLLDLRMPKMDGWVAARHIRTLEGGRDVPIIAVTVTASPGAEAYALHAGCNEFLTKPISDYSLLLSRIEHWLGRGGRPVAAAQPQRAPAPRPERAVHPPRAAAPRPDASASDMVCILCNQALPSPSATMHEKRRDLTAHPLPHA